MTLAIVGRTGSGKSYAAKGMIEAELAAGERVCIVDPSGAWLGLRLKADGKKAAFPVVIFGGDHADVPIAVGQGDQLGAWIAKGDVRQAVVDVSTMSTGEYTSFLTAFLERLFTANRERLRLVLDEADVVAPQNPMPEQRRLQGATNKIVRRGRIKGFAPILITQRPAVLDKSVLGQHSVAREWIADQLGMAPRGGHWNAAWKELRDNRIVEMIGAGACLTELFQPKEGHAPK